MARPRREQLLEMDSVERRRGCKDLVPLDRDRCANCDAVLVEDSSAQPALFLHGGYGETQRGTAMWCPECGWKDGHGRTAENPRERAHRNEKP